jgi:hypothetical protein
MLWIRIRIDLAVLDPDPDAGAWKYTKINQVTWLHVFQKGFVSLYVCFSHYYLH